LGTVLLAALSVVVAVSLILPPLMRYRHRVVRDLTLADVGWFGSAEMAYRTVAVSRTAAIRQMNDQRSSDPQWWSELSLLFGIMAATATSWSLAPPPDRLRELAVRFDLWMREISQAAIVCHAETCAHNHDDCAQRLRDADLASLEVTRMMTELRVALLEHRIHISNDLTAA
jgi:hypothetical protein